MRSYERDYLGWVEDTARAICDGRWSEIDRAASAEEVESLGKQERQRIVSHLAQLLLHLLKQRFQPLKTSRNWDLTIREQRSRVCELSDFVMGEAGICQKLKSFLRVNSEVRQHDEHKDEHRSTGN